MVSEKFPICPYLGLEGDPDTSMAFPSVANRCYRHNRGKRIALVYQREVCLTLEYETCQIYQNQQKSGPENTALQRSPVRVWRILLDLLGVGILLSALFLLSQRFLSFSLSSSPPPPSASASLEAELTISGLPPAVPMSPTSISTDLASPSPAPAATIFPPTFDLSSHVLDVPIGGGQKFIIHKVRSGESLSFYASRYNTTVEAILAVNYRFYRLWSDAVVIIPVDTTTTEGLPSFEAYQVTQAITPRDLAIRLGVRVVDLLYYNGLEADDLTLPPGIWLLIPR